MSKKTGLNRLQKWTLIMLFISIFLLVKLGGKGTEHLNLPFKGMDFQIDRTIVALILAVCITALFWIAFFFSRSDKKSNINGSQSATS